MKGYDLSATDLSQYAGLTDEERQAWLNPLPNSYHSFHVERMGENVYRWRDSREARFYVGNADELLAAICAMKLRKIDPDYQTQTQVLKILSQDEIDDLFSDL